MRELLIKSVAVPRKIIFIFHGYGADKTNMEPIGKAFSRFFDNAEIHMPDGIHECEEGIGLCWFTYDDNDVGEMYKSYLQSESEIKNYVDTVISKNNLTYDDVVFAGFSQGAMLALTLGLKLEVSDYFFCGNVDKSRFRMRQIKCPHRSRRA